MNNIIYRKSNKLRNTAFARELGKLIFYNDTTKWIFVKDLEDRAVSNRFNLQEHIDNMIYNEHSLNVFFLNTWEIMELIEYIEFEHGIKTYVNDKYLLDIEEVVS